MKVLLMRWLRFHLLYCIEHHDTRAVVDTSKVECAYGVYTYTCGLVLKVENQRRQKVHTAYGKKLVSHFFLAVVDTSKVECAYGMYTYTCGLVLLKVLLMRWLCFHILYCIEHHDTRAW